MTKSYTNWILITFAVVAAVGIGYLKQQKSPVEITTPPPAPKVDYAKLIQLHTDQADRRNINALRAFEIKLNALVDRHAEKLAEAGEHAAAGATTYVACGQVVYYLAKDKMTGRSDTESFLDEKIRPEIERQMNAFCKEVNSAVDELHLELQRSTVLLSADLATLHPSAEEEKKFTGNVEVMNRLDLQQALRNLGLNAATVPIAIGFDSYAIWKAKLPGILWGKIKETAARRFGKQVAKLGGSAGLAVVDGPIPVGDILAIVGVIWTGWDVYSAQKEFRKEVHVSMKNLLNEERHELHRNALDHATGLAKEYQSLQEKIGTETLTQNTNNKS